MSILRLIRLIAIACLAATVTACAGAPPKEPVTNEATRAAIHIAQVSVDVSEVGQATKGRPMPAGEAKAIIEKALNQTLVGEGSGKRAARAVVRVTSINIISAGQSMMVGGESVMKGTVALVDSTSGAVLMNPVEISSGGGGWVMGGIFGAASLEDPKTEVQQMGLEFGRRAHVAIFGK